MGLSPEQASARSTAALLESETISGRLTDLEAKLQSLKGDYMLLNLRLVARDVSAGTATQRRGHSRATSPAAHSDRSWPSEGSSCSRASSVHEAALHLALAKSRKDTHAMITAAQSIAYFRRQPEHEEDDPRRPGVPE